MREKLAPYLHKECEFKAQIGRFGMNWTCQLVVLLVELSTAEEVIADHIWIRKKVPEYITSFQTGDWITFRAKVCMYQRINSNVWEYGIKHPKQIRQITK